MSCYFETLAKTAYHSVSALADILDLRSVTDHCLASHILTKMLIANANIKPIKPTDDILRVAPLLKGKGLAALHVPPKQKSMQFSASHLMRQLPLRQN